MRLISTNHLRSFTAQILTKAGFPSVDAATIASSLILSESMGYSSHGLMRVYDYVMSLERGITAHTAQLTIVQETPNSLTVDAGFGAGQVVMPMVLQRLYAKLEVQAVVTAAVRNSGHIGRVGEWVEKTAEKGYPSLLMVNDNGVQLHVAPPGGKQAVTSTNPIAFAFPLADGKIFMTDMSTSAVAFGKVKVAKLNGTQMPPDCIQDAYGNPTQDPKALFMDPPGNIMPMGGAQGYKGFALSMLIDLLVAGLSGGQTPPASPDTKYANNLMLTLWNPKFFVGLSHMQAETEKYLAFVRASTPTNLDKPIRIPGDRRDAAQTTSASQGIVLSDQLSASLIKLAQKFSVAVPTELKSPG